MKEPRWRGAIEFQYQQAEVAHFQTKIAQLVQNKNNLNSVAMKS